MQKPLFFIFLLVAIALLAAFQPQATPLALTDETPVAQVLLELGAEPAAHQVDLAVADVSVEAGRRLVLEGVARGPQGGNSLRQSKHFVCTSCHNVVKEDPDLRYADPEARLAYVAKNGLSLLPGTTLYGVVNRKTFYNDDYEKKYGDLVRSARHNLREAIALCATECAQGRPLADWEMESILSYLWTIDLKMGDLNLPASSLSVVQAGLSGAGNREQAADLLQSYFLDHSPAHFLTPPPNRETGYGLVGVPANGQLVYEASCLHCHGEQRYSFFNLDNSKYTFEFLEKHFPLYTRYSTYQVVRYGTSPLAGKRAYMPHYTQERMSNQQVEDLRAYVTQHAQ